MAPDVSNPIYLDCGTNPVSRDHEVMDGPTSHRYLLLHRDHGAGFKALPPVRAPLLQGSARERKPSPAVKQGRKEPVALPFSLDALEGQGRWQSPCCFSSSACVLFPQCLSKGNCSSQLSLGRC